MTVGQSSNSYNFSSQYSVGEMLINSFERIGKSPAELTQTMMASARRSLQLILQAQASKGPSL